AHVFQQLIAFEWLKPSYAVISAGRPSLGREAGKSASLRGGGHLPLLLRGGGATLMRPAPSPCCRCGAWGLRPRPPPPFPPRHHHNEVARLIDDRHHGIVIVLVDPDREERTLGLAAVLGHAPGLAGHLENGLLYVELLPAGGCDVLRILGSENERRVALRIE